MAEIKRVDSLEIGEDLDFTRRQWRIQRIGWVAFLLILVFGLAGGFGGGPLSHTTATAGALTLDYQRFARQRGPTSLEFRIAPAAAMPGDDQVAVWIATDFLDAIDLEGIEPDPAESLAGADRVVYHFALADPSRPAQITFAYQPATVGMVSIHAGIVGRDELAVGQFTWP
ncbi:MAG: hypothetical protein IT338_12105 [Thermomicrobiales bacterium]|nr:hypothetical protein [Thermomicrobiales bacterium]